MATDPNQLLNDPTIQTLGAPTVPAAAPFNLAALNDSLRGRQVPMRFLGRLLAAQGTPQFDQLMQKRGERIGLTPELFQQVAANREPLMNEWQTQFQAQHPGLARFSNLGARLMGGGWATPAAPVNPAAPPAPVAGTALPPAATVQGGQIPGEDVFGAGDERRGGGFGRRRGSGFGL